jgi:dipeptidyl aminopeptidase/acylaminoacyl peptidase
MRHRIACCALILLAASVACHRSGAEAAVPAYSPLQAFPPLGPGTLVEPGVVVHHVSLAHGAYAGRIWIYLPAKLPRDPIPCVFIAPAGVPPFVGNGFGPDLDRQRDPEHLPYVHAGFAVVAYDVDGEIANPNDATYADVAAAAKAFKDADAGMLNARHAIDYVLKMVPIIDRQRLYSAGHSSAGRISLLLAETDPRIAACVAYAPVTDVERRVAQVSADAGRYLASNLPGFRDFLRRSSPLRQVARLRCPLFLFHSETDGRIPIADSVAFVAALKKTNPRVTFVRGTRGDHYQSMIEDGVPQAIQWLRSLSAR